MFTILNKDILESSESDSVFSDFFIMIFKKDAKTYGQLHVKIFAWASFCLVLVVLFAETIANYIVFGAK
jgi:hypothetical protein